MRKAIELIIVLLMVMYIWMYSVYAVSTHIIRQHPVFDMNTLFDYVVIAAMSIAFGAIVSYIFVSIIKQFKK